MSPRLEPKWPPGFPASVRDLDTRRPALFEASAGTGKTYAIEHLVLRLMLEDDDLKPEQILLLSFTEKTAADLRKRIRERLYAEWTGEGEGFWDEAARARIHKAWLHCDDLAIHTIHGFCHAALLRYPIANDALIRPDVLDDKTLADDALENLLRGAWAKDPQRLSRFRDALKIGSRDDWRKNLVALALAYQEKRGDVIQPDRDPRTVEPLEEEVRAATSMLADVVAGLERSSFTASEHRKAFAFTKTGRPKKDWEDDLRKDAYHRVFLMMEQSSSERPAAVFEFFGEAFNGTTRVAKKGWAACLPEGAAGLSEWNLLAEVCDRLWKLPKELAAALKMRQLGLQAEAARELRDELAREKQRRGAISYDDMTQNLADALARNPELAPKLRRLYKVCIVDEFQDTDLQQWTILQALCLDGEAPPPLFLVGDPKQAIYAFRGGDLQTYLTARDQLRGLAEQTPPRAQGVALIENFRSSPALIQSLNAVFEQPVWFGAADAIHTESAWKLSTSKEIVFTRVRPGRITATTAAETKSAPALWIRDLRHKDEDKPPAKRHVERELRHWIAARILDLTSGRDGARGYRDIAVLVRKHSEAAALEKLLRKRGIPCRVRRTGGVFHGEGADALRLLLELIPAAADPATQAKILLLPFLRRAGTDWPLGRPAFTPPLLERWMLLADAARWPEFFESVLRDSGHLARVAEGSESDAARLLALGRALGEAGATPGTTAAALADRFDALRRGEGEGDEGVVEEGEENREGGETAGSGAVTVMTLHMSKGLEFPVVFLAAAGAGKKPRFLTLREDRGFRHVLDTKDETARPEYDRQTEAEDKRLFYVAFTRAKDRLYAPLLPQSKGQTQYGPLGGFAAEALSAVAENAEANLIHWDNEPVFAAHAPVPKAGANANTGEGRAGAVPAEHNAAAFSRIRRLNSYSGLAKHVAEKSSVEELLGEDGKRAVRDEITAAETLDAETVSIATPITREELPAGAAAGNALHGLLEVTDFASVLRAETPAEWLGQPGRRRQIETFLRKEGLDPACAGAVARAVWNTLRMPLPDPSSPGATLRLADVSDHLHEVEFLFPAAFRKGLPEGIERSGDFLWGFIDLVFRHQGRYYLLDWKSNLLDSYDEGSVLASMEHSRYDLQWQLYSVALDRWLSKRLSGYDPEKHFGGVFYLYLRGAAPDRFSGFRYLPTPGELRGQYPERLAKLLGLRPNPGNAGALP